MATTIVVIQTLSQGMDRRLSVLVDALVDLLQPRGILARNDPKVRRLEGLPEQIEVVHGDDARRRRSPKKPESATPSTCGTARRPDCSSTSGRTTWRRRDTRAGARWTCFTYQGGFALPMARRAEAVLALDSSAPAVAAIRENARRNGLTNVEVREANVFDELRELEIADQRFDTIVLDPPAFAKNKAAVERAIAGYKEINLRALKLLRPGGHLADLQLLLQRGRNALPGRGRGRGERRAGRRHARREAHAGARPSGLARCARNALSEMPRAPEAWTDRPAEPQTGDQAPVVRFLHPFQRMTRRVVRLVVPVFFLAFWAAPALAQGPVGVRAGVSGDPDQFYFGAHVESKPLLRNFTFRPNAEIGIGDDATLIALNFEFAYSIPIRNEPWRVYLGGGPALNIYSFEGRDGDVGGGFNIVLGAQHRGGLFTELKVGMIDSPNIKFGVGFVF